MVMIKDLKYGKERYAIPTRAYQMIERIKQKIKNDDSEFWMAWSGDTGSGKSLAAMKWGYAIDPTLSLDRVCFDAEEFVDAVIKGKKGQVIIADEGIVIFFNRASMTKEGRLVSELAAQIRQKNMCIMICIPDILSVDWMIQSKFQAVIDVWESRKMQAGRYLTVKGNLGIYPEFRKFRGKTFLINYLKAKRRNPMVKIKKPKPFIRVAGNAIGPNCKKPWYPVGEKAYKEKKEAVLKKYRKIDEKELTGKEKQAAKWKAQRDEIIKLLNKQENYSIGKLSKLLSFSKSTIHAIITKKKERVKNINQ